MQENQKLETQKNFFIAILLSMAIFLSWSYFFPAEVPEDANSNSNSNTSEAVTKKTTEKKPEKVAKKKPEIPDSVENRRVKIKTPLYEVELDSRGAVATSWILKVNDSPYESERQPLWADGSYGDKKIPLQLISQRGLKDGRAPFKIRTKDKALDDLLNSRNYSVSVEDAVIELSGSESKEIEFKLDGPDGVSSTKKLVFRADSYITDLSLELTKDGKTVPNTTVAIGPSIGDQNIKQYTFYTVAPEAVFTTPEDQQRIYAASTISEDGVSGELNFQGNVEWAAVSDTYFAMALIPAKPVPGLSVTSWQYTEKTEPFYDGIFATLTMSETDEVTKHHITAYVPVTADGSVNRLYTGSKDYFVLHKYNPVLSEMAGRTIDIEDLVNYGWLYFMTKPLSVPILYALRWLTTITANYGISLLVFTFFFYMTLFPLRWYSSKSFKKAQKNQPKMQEIRDKIKKLQDKGVPMEDPKMRDLQMEQLKMTKDALPIGGCLPLLLQFPLLITLYYTVSIAVGFRQESFLWLLDLSQADPFKILPIAFAVSMVLTFKFSPTTPAVTPEQIMQQKMMTYMMPVMMLLFMWTAPAGLLLYWFFGNIIMFGQQMFINWANKDPDNPSAPGKLETKKA